MKLQYLLVYENISDKLILGIAGPGSSSWHDFGIYPFTAMQTIRSYNSTLVQARKLILRMHVYLIIIYKFYKYCHA